MLDAGNSVSVIPCELCASHRNINYDFFGGLSEEQQQQQHTNISPANVLVNSEERGEQVGASSLDKLNNVDNPFPKWMLISFKITPRNNSNN